MPASDDATRRTRLAAERTELAWWRTGLTALAVALGVGRVIPALDSSLVRWPYAALGTAFAVYGIALICFGSVRARLRARSARAADGDEQCQRALHRTSRPRTSTRDGPTTARIPDNPCQDARRPITTRWMPPASGTVDVFGNPARRTRSETRPA